MGDSSNKEESNDVNDEEVLVGPELPVAKKRKILPFEEQFLQRLPLSDMYEKSYMHRDWVTHIVVAQATEFIVTGSIDGVVKFWKKTEQGIEFAKQFKSHVEPLVGLCVSPDGSLCASIAKDKTAKVFDVATFDMIAILKLDYEPGHACWGYKKKSARHFLIISERTKPDAHVYDIRENSSKPMSTVKFHGAPITAMAFNEQQDAVISCDEKGSIEYWSPSEGQLIKDGLSFTSKFSTDLYALMKSKATACALAISPDGSKFAIMSSDKRIRLFKYLSGKLSKVFDESLEAIQELQKGDVGKKSFFLWYFGSEMQTIDILFPSCWMTTQKCSNWIPSILEDA